MPKPMTNGLKNSDEAIVPVRAANKERKLRWSRWRKGLNQGDPDGQSTPRTQSRASVSQAAARIRKSRREKPEGTSHCAPAPPHAGGARGGLLLIEEGRPSGYRRHDVAQVRRGSGRAPARPAPAPAPRGSVPAAAASARGDTQADGGKRQLGIAVLEDKIVQKAVGT